jgi:hypothetical protein
MLHIYYYPSSDLFCNTYELNLEVRAISSITSGVKECTTSKSVDPTTFVNARNVMDTENWLSWIIGDNGYTIHDEVYNYTRES